MPLNNKLPPNLKSDHLNANRSPKTPLKATTNGVAGRSMAPGAPNSKHHQGPSFKSIKHNKGEHMNFIRDHKYNTLSNQPMHHYDI